MPFSLLRPLAPISVAVLLLASCGDSAKPAAAVVNGQRITDAEVERSIPLFEFLGDVQQAGCGSAVPGESAAAACARFVLHRLIEEELVKEYAEGRDLTVDETEREETFGSLEQQLGPQLDELLQRHDLETADVKAFIDRLLLFRTVQTELAERLVSEAELRREYETRKAEFTQNIHTWHILVKDQKLAEKIAAEVTPQNFAELARKYSIDPGSKRKGGDLGTFPVQQLDSDFVTGALALEPGEISEPVHTQFGWHIIRLIEADTPSFEEVREFLLREAGGDALSDWLSNRLESAEISVNPRYGRLDVEAREIVPIRSTATDPAAASPTASETPAPAQS